MATKPKYTNRTKATVWNKDMRLNITGALPSVAISIFTMINTLEGKEKALAQMQYHLSDCKERQAREANHADVQAM